MPRPSLPLELHAHALQHALGVIAASAPGRSTVVRPRRTGRRAAARTSPARSRSAARSRCRASCAPPRIRTGGLPSVGLDARAHLCAAASATRSIGRCMQRRVADQLAVERLPASRPVKSRIAVPALPMSSTLRAARAARADRRRRRARRRGARCRSARRVPRSAACVARQSSLSRKPWTAVDAFGDRAEHQRAMRDRLVAGHRDACPRRRPPGRRES